MTSYTTKMAAGGLGIAFCDGRRVVKALVYHECTGRFLRSIFHHYLGHLYDVHGFDAPEA